MKFTAIEILIHLLPKKRVTAKKLAERLEVSTKTIYRMVNALSCAGIPVYTMTGKQGGIFLDKDFDIRSIVGNK